MNIEWFSRQICENKSTFLLIFISKHSMVRILTETTSIADQFLMEMRDKSIQKDRARFRGNMERLGIIMAYEISKALAFKQITVQTSLGEAKARVVADPPVLLTVLRAGLPFFAGFQKVFDRADAGFVGAMRVEGKNTIKIKMDYVATPNLGGRDVLLIDPMLATGLSITDSVSAVLRNGTPRNLHIASLISARAGIEHVKANVNIPHTIWTFAVDETLNDLFYIVPGLGDAGDLSFGDKL
jgi:uracil phosphoribosyltransferase